MVEGLRRFSRSVGAKLFTAVLTVLLLTLAALGFVNVRLQRKHFETMRRDSAERMSDVIRRSTTYTMLRNDRDALRQIVATIGRDPDIVSLRILDANARVRLSTHEDEIGKILFERRPIPAVQQSEIFTQRGARVLGVVTPILNAPSCSTAACHAHDPQQKVLGLLDVDLSLAGADAGLRRASFQFVALSAVLILLTLATIGALVLRLVHRPVAALKQATRELGSGRLGVQIPVDSDDELGALAQSFNRMSSQLREANEEITAAAQMLERRVQEKTAELQRAHLQMIQAEKLTSLGKLAAVVAHEINNPLSGILTYARLMRKWIDRGDPLETHAEEMRDSLHVIESESRRCGEIVRNLLMFARVAPMNIADVDLNAVVKQCIRVIEHRLELGNIALHLELAPSLPPIRGDAGQLEQLLLALVMNAIDAMPHEGNLAIVTTTAPGERVVVSVADDGCGIPPDVLPRLFDPFVTTKEEGKGVGLGLAISRSIVDRHHGQIAVDSEPGRGTTFTITLPCNAIVDEKPAIPSYAAPEVPA